MILVLGAGVAGMSAALAAATEGADVHLVCANALRPPTGAPTPCNTALAQGGIAAAIGAGDTTESHTQDTINAGAGIVDPGAAQLLTRAGADQVRTLIRQGLPVDRAADGTPALGLEAAHSHARIVHAGEDRTGARLYELLVTQVLEMVAAGRILLTEHRTLTELITRDGAIAGAMLQDPLGGLHTNEADAVILATGGYAALWSRTSNHAGARGDGIVCAAHAGAIVSDLEFVQFHPTVLGNTGFLISEAVRGAGAVLRDGSGSRYMREPHPAAELAPRDVVSRETHRVLRQRGETEVWLDATSIEHAGGAGTLARRFPKITAAVAAHGYNWAHEAIPVAPAAHYTMGGVATDSDGRTTVPGLFAAGEAAATGVHGANRLASNSLLEGLVFGDRAGRAAAAHRTATAQWTYRGAALPTLLARNDLGEHHIDIELPLHRSAQTVATGSTEAATLQHPNINVDMALGIERDAAGLQPLITRQRSLSSSNNAAAAHLTALIAAAALARTESRGAHQRADYPHTDPDQAHRRGWRVTVTPTASIKQRSLAAC